MKKFYFILIFIFYCGSAFAQNEGNQWISYEGSGLDFNGDTIIANSFPSNMPIWRCNASICDKNGKLLFYTNGAEVYNRNFKLMEHGDNLNLGDFSYFSPIHDGAVIVPFVGDTNKYYLFHTDLKEINVAGYGNLLLSANLYYDVINMALDNGNGGIINSEKEVLFFSDTLCNCGIQAVKHGNGRDWWLICHEYGSNNYYRFLIDEKGLHGPFVQSIGMVYATIDAYGYFGNIKFNQQGNQFIKNNSDSTLFELYDFDRCTGELSNERKIRVSDTLYELSGLSFSPNGRFAYLSANFWRYLLQFDLQSNDIEKSEILVGVYDGTLNPFQTNFYDHQLGSDGKIYICNYNGNASLHVINNPDSAGKKCNFVQNGVTLYPNTYWGSGMPNLPNYSLGPLTGSGCDTIVTFTSSETLTVFKHGVYPNPCSGKFQLSITGISSEVPIAIYNTMGKLIYETTLHPQNDFIHGFFNLQNEPTGIYLLKAETNHGEVTEKIVKE